ncbi:unnamed protein product [Protopolystoma xenopodis]|uniref:Uncharacterized protein n=1 Tax=Protopolystoma xenopodis TaxID=117903 RepID=A0A448WEY6_9PLAT|nr:unnamed protein product [Protopolystoma xenopodis]
MSGLAARLSDSDPTSPDQLFPAQLSGESFGKPSSASSGGRPSVATLSSLSSIIQTGDRRFQTVFGSASALSDDLGLVSNTSRMASAPPVFAIDIRWSGLPLASLGPSEMGLQIDSAKAAVEPEASRVLPASGVPSFQHEGRSTTWAYLSTYSIPSAVSSSSVLPKISSQTHLATNTIETSSKPLSLDRSGPSNSQISPLPCYLLSELRERAHLKAWQMNFRTKSLAHTDVSNSVDTSGAVSFTALPSSNVPKSAAKPLVTTELNKRFVKHWQTSSHNRPKLKIQRSGGFTNSDITEDEVYHYADIDNSAGDSTEEEKEDPDFRMLDQSGEKMRHVSKTVDFL